MHRDPKLIKYSKADYLFFLFNIYLFILGQTSYKSKVIICQEECTWRHFFYC